MRSSVVPQTIASDTAQNTNWKNHFDSIVALDRSITGKLGWNTVVPPEVTEFAPRFVKKAPPSCPMKLPSGPPNANMKPTAHQAIAAIEKLVRIFATTVPAFLAREKPISRNAKPACMNMTRAPATITHIVLMPTDASSLPAIALLRSVASPNAVPGMASRASTASGSSARYLRLIRRFLLAHRGTLARQSRFRTDRKVGAARSEVSGPVSRLRPRCLYRRSNSPASVHGPVGQGTGWPGDSPYRGAKRR